MNDKTPLNCWQIQSLPSKSLETRCSGSSGKPQHYGNQNLGLVDCLEHNKAIVEMYRSLTLRQVKDAATDYA